MVRTFNRSFNRALQHPIARLHPRMVVTTNYDRVIDQTMPWLVPLLPNTFRQNAFRDEDVLLKLHGTIEKPESWVLTRFQYATAYRELLWSELRDLFANQTVLFVGCSLGTDMFLDALRTMPPGRAPRHYAILHVRSNDEATARGEELERLGILVIPYITDDHDHTIVERILHEIRPPLQKTLSYVDRLRLSGHYVRAMRVLEVQSLDTANVLTRTQVAMKMAEVLQSYRDAHPDPATWAIESVLQWARRAADLGPASDLVTGVAVDVLRLAGQRDPEIEGRLKRPQPPSASRTVSATKDETMQAAYQTLRGGHAAALLDQIKRIEHRGQYASRAGVAERLEILRIRSLLVLGSEELATRGAQQLPATIRPFGSALIAFSRKAPAATLNELDVLDRRWRASSQPTGRPGLVFSLSLRTLAHLGLSNFDAAAHAASRAIAAHDPNARKADRLFRKEGVPSELCFDVRRLGSSELLSILRCLDWISRAALRNDTDEHDLTALRNLVHQSLPTGCCAGIGSCLHSFFPIPLPSAVSSSERSMNCCARQGTKAAACCSK